MKKTINIAVVGLGQVGIYLYNELNIKKKDIEVKTGKKINIVAISARNINKKRKETKKKLSTILKKTDDITAMTLEEYEIYIDDHTKKSKYPDISQ